MGVAASVGILTKVRCGEVLCTFKVREVLCREVLLFKRRKKEHTIKYVQNGVRCQIAGLR